MLADVATTRVPFAIPGTVGVKVIVKESGWPAFRVTGSGIDDTVNGPLATLGAMREIVVGSEPELVMVKVTGSDWPTSTGGLKTTEPPVAGFTVVVTPFDVYV